MFFKNKKLYCSIYESKLEEIKLKYNKEKLRAISAFEDNWNQYGAKKIPQRVIEMMYDILENIHIQPEVFPVACESIQFEYDNKNGDYLEFEIFEDGSLKTYILYVDDSEYIETVKVDIDYINNKVDDFYLLKRQ